jgi:hypothetical protein
MHEPASSPSEPRRIKRWLCSALALLVIYGNVAVTLHPSKLGLGPHVPALPRSFALLDAFLIPGMFSGYTTYNYDFVIEGQRSQSGRIKDRGQFIELPLPDHFPLRYPITYTQLFAAHHWDMLGPSAQRGAWAVYGRKIKARHNRLHPEARITRLRFGILAYPQDPRGYRAAKHDGRTWKKLWYAEPEP